jgi:hypothetical protein
MPDLEKAFSLSKDKNLFIWTNRFPARYLEGFEELIQNPKKIIDEVRGRRELFAGHLMTGKMLDCYPKRCKFCFLNDFCRDLIIFKRTGRSESKKSPNCLKNKKEKTVKVLEHNENIDINDFADFYINYRYFVKSKRCAACKINKSCQGAHINLIRQRGFKILKPIK